MIAIDMEMPESCMDCRNSYGLTWCHYVHCDVGEFWEERHPDCPIKELEVEAMALDRDTESGGVKVLKRYKIKEV